MAISTATPEDVAPYLQRPLTDSEAETARGLLDAAWLRLHVLIPGLNARIDSGAVSADLVTSIQAEMVATAMKNPLGLRSRSTTLSIDDYTETNNETIDRALTEGALMPTDAQLRLLRPAGAGAFTIRPGA